MWFLPEWFCQGQNTGLLLFWISAILQSLAHGMFLINISWMNESQLDFRKLYFFQLTYATAQQCLILCFSYSGYLTAFTDSVELLLEHIKCLSYNFLPWELRRSTIVTSHQSALQIKMNLPAESSHSLSIQTICGCRLASAGST